MPDPSPESRHIRRIAILVASVDAEAAKQILVGLPASIAQGVRSRLQDIGEVSEQEREQLVRDLQAARQPAAPAAPQTPTMQDQCVATASWSHVSSEALVRLVSQERPLVVAVVVSNLPSNQATTVLAALPHAIACEALQCLTNLAEMQPGVRRELDVYLHRKLSELQNKIATESKNQHRLRELLEQVPPALQSEWQRSIGAVEPAKGVSDTSGVNSSISAPLTGGGTSTDSPHAANETHSAPQASLPLSHAITTQHVSLAESRSRQRKEELQPSNPVDRSLIQLEFEQLLELPPSILQSILTRAAPEVVLLAFAGASSAFMQRFRAMIEQEDFADLTQRIHQIGAMRLSDIDEAQLRLIDLTKGVLEQYRSTELKTAS